MKLKTRILLLLFIVMMSTVFTACQSGEHKKAKDTVTVYVSNISYLSTYAPYIESQFPDLNIRFIAGIVPEDYHAQVFFENANRIYKLGL